MPAAKKITFKELLEMLLDENKPFPARYLHRFSDLTPGQQTLLQNKWSHVSLHRRQALIEDLENLGDADHLLSFEGVCRLALRDDDPLIRAGAIRILADYEEIEFLSIFIDMAEHDEEVFVREAAATALGPFVYMGEVDLLSKKVLRNLEDKLLAIASGNDDPSVRMQALESLGYSSRDEVNPLIVTAYKSGELRWLCTALFAMGRSANSVWENKVLPMLDHRSPEVRVEAASAAGGLESKAAVERLLELLDDENIQVRLASIWALSEIGGPGVRSAFMRMLEQTDDEEEARLLEDALDNLSFNDGSGGFEMLDIHHADEEDDEDLFFLDDDEVEVET